jgi:Protein of unknown function (DUF2865)
LRTELPFQRKRRLLMLIAVAIVVPVVLAPGLASAEGLFDFLFGGMQKPQQQKAPPQANFFADPFGSTPQPAAPSRPVVASSGPAFCVRSCDGKYFPLMRSTASPTQICQAFCPASPTEVFFGSSIEVANAASGERYTDSENAFSYRKALRADCTCNGRNPAGLAPVDLALDDSLRAGDVLATHDGLVAYSGMRADQTPGFTPLASFLGLTPQVRARLNDMKVAPSPADMAESGEQARIAQVQALAAEQQRQRDEVERQRQKEIAQAKIDAQSGDPLIGNWKSENMITLRITQNGSLYVVHVNNSVGPLGVYAGPYKDGQIILGRELGNLALLSDKKQLMFSGGMFTKVGQ